MNAEIVSRLESSFRSVDVNDAAGILLDAQRAQEMVDAQRKIISAQEVNLIVLSTYLVDVINALPQKLRNEERIKAAAHFVLGLGEETANGTAQQGLLQLNTPFPVETVKAVVRGKPVETGVALVQKRSAKRADQLRDLSAEVTASDEKKPIHKVIVVGKVARDPNLNYRAEAPKSQAKGPAKSSNARKRVT